MRIQIVDQPSQKIPLNGHNAEDGLMVNNWCDIDLGPPMVPYVGAGVRSVFLDAKETTVQTGVTFLQDHTERQGHLIVVGTRVQC